MHEPGKGTINIAKKMKDSNTDRKIGRTQAQAQQKNPNTSTVNVAKKARQQYQKYSFQ